jgi:hypothetical protein
MVLRKRERSSTRTSFWSGSEQEYRQFPSALMTRAMAWVGVKDGGGVEVSSAAAKTLRFGRPILGSLNNGLTSRGFWVGKIAIGLDQDVFALELELFCSSVGLGKKKLYSEPGPEPEKHLYGGVLNPGRNRQAKDDLPFTFTFSAAPPSCTEMLSCTSRRPDSSYRELVSGAHVPQCVLPVADPADPGSIGPVIDFQ